MASSAREADRMGGNTACTDQSLGDGDGDSVAEAVGDKEVDGVCVGVSVAETEEVLESVGPMVALADQEMDAVMVADCDAVLVEEPVSAGTAGTGAAGEQVRKGE
jgi:hypothetical protein